MIIETKEEEKALNFILNLASEETSRRGCNDLNKKDEEQFKDMVITDDERIIRKIMYDFDLIQFIREKMRVKNV